MHSILIWLFPFVWIMILKSILKPTPGSYTFKNKKDPDKMDDNTSGLAMLDSPTDLGHSGGGHSQ